MEKKSKGTSAKAATTNTRTNYWYTLIILESDTHKDQLAAIAKRMRISRTKIIGKLIESFIAKNG